MINLSNNRLDKIKQEFLKQFQVKLDEENIDLSVESAFDILISADPSRNKKNVRWLVETYLDDGFLWEDLVTNFPQEDLLGVNLQCNGNITISDVSIIGVEDVNAGEHSKVYETLNTFIRNKNKLDILDRSINRYQSIADMWKMVKQYSDNKTGKEIKRDEHNKAMTETEMVIDNDDMRIIVPLTEYAAKFHGRGTRWCTAADNNNMFKIYADKAPLFIITLKESGDKLQLWKNGSNVQFMDEDDKTVSKEYVEQNWNLLKDIIKHIGKLKFVSHNVLTPELCRLAVEQNGMALKYIPDMTSDGVLLKTPELCKLSVEQKGFALQFVPKELITPELCEIACEQNGLALQEVPYELITYKMCKIACEQNGSALKYVPKEYKTLTLCEIAVKRNGSALQFIPEQFLTPELCKIACEQDGTALEYVPDMTSEGVSLKTPELCKLACEQDGKTLCYITYDLRTPELCEIAVKQDRRLLALVPEELRTPELCKIACEQDVEEISENITVEEFAIPTDVYKQEIDKLKIILTIPSV